MFKPIDDFYLGLPIDYLDKFDIYLRIQPDEKAYKLVGFKTSGIILKPPIFQLAVTEDLLKNK